jgi:O-antigen ligase
VRRWDAQRMGEWRFAVFALIAAAAAGTIGAAIAYSPALAAAGLAFVVLLAVSRSREATVTLWLGIRVLMFSGYVPTAVGEAALVLIPIVALIRRISSGRRLRAPRSQYLWLLLLLLVGLNIAYFGFVAESRNYAIEIFVENFLMITLIANTKSRWSRDGAVTAVAVILLGIGIIAGLEWVLGRPLLLNAGRIDYETRWGIFQTFEGTRRLGSILLQPDLLAAAMALGFVVWIGIALERRGLLRWFAGISATGLMWVGLLTFGRAVLIGAAVGLGVLCVFALTSDRGAIRRAPLALAGVCSAGFLALLVVPDAWLRLTSTPIDPVRLDAAQTALRIIVAHPLGGLGAGWNRYLALAESYRYTGLYSRPLANPHNSFLELGAMLGLPIAVAVILLIGKVLLGAFSPRQLEPGSAVPYAGMAVLIVIAFTANVLTIPVLSNVFWALWAVAGRRSPEGASRAVPLVRAWRSESAHLVAEPR